MMSANKQNIVKGSRGHTSRAEARQGRHHRTQQEFRRPRFTSPIPELEVLRFETGDSSNLIIWTKKLSTYAIRTFGQLGQIFETGNYWVPDEIEEPAPNAFEFERDPYGFARKIHLRLLEEREKLIYEMRMKRPQLYAVIWGQLSFESQEQVRTDPDFDEANAEKDPLLLYQIVRRTHIAGRIVDAITTRYNARESYKKLRQGANESIHSFKERFDAAVEVLQNAGVNQLEEQDYAVDFMRKLDRGRFSHMIVDLENNLLKGAGTFPTTLQEMYTLCANYRNQYVVEVNIKTQSLL